MSRPRLLYVPIAAALEAERVFDLVDWAETASFDSPGAGANRDASPHGIVGVVAAAIDRLDELGWDTCTVVCDSHGQAAGIELALASPERVEGIGIAHAAARYALGGERPAMVPAMHAAAEQLLETDYRSFGYAVVQMTQGLAEEAYVDAWLEAVPREVAQSILGDLTERQPELVSRLRDATMPVVLGEHHGCVMWTPEAFEDACEAVPHARRIVCDGIPSQDPRFLEAIRGFVRSE
jgi:pimeloyl-ACP methyl ester carboxylesterase